jgi:hypothetical protein
MTGGTPQHPTHESVDAVRLYGAPEHDTSDPVPERERYETRSGWGSDEDPADAAAGAPAATAD